MQLEDGQIGPLWISRDLENKDTPPLLLLSRHADVLNANRQFKSTRGRRNRHSRLQACASGLPIPAKIIRAQRHSQRGHLGAATCA
jgi:hypothetical protein